MRSRSRTLATGLLPAARGVRSVRRRSGRHGLTLLGWHRVHGATSNGLSTSVPDFRRHLDEVERWGARILPLDDAVRRLYDGSLPDRAVALTFDDGYASVLETAWPLLRDRGWPATLFVVTDALTGAARFPWDDGDPPDGPHRLATAEQLLAAHADGLDLGSHTRSHRWLPDLDAGSTRSELSESRVALQELLERRVTSVAYPSGGWNRTVREAAARAGYRIGITVDRGLNTSRSHPLSLRRAFAPARAADLRLIMDGAYTFLRPLDSWRSRSGPAW